jgi:hypothetical protein
VLEGVINSMGIDTSYVENLGDKAGDFEERVGKPKGKKKHLLLYVEFSSEEEFDYVQEILCDKKTQKMNKDRFMEMLNKNDS